MRVVVVTTWFPDAERPGAAPFVLAHAKAIGLRNSVEVFHARLGGRGPVRTDEVDGVPVTSVPVDPCTPREFGVALNHLRAMVRGADIVHTMAFSSIGVLAPLYPLVASRWVHTEHWTGVGFPEQVSVSWRRLAALRHLLRLPRRVSAVSTHFADVVQRFARPGCVDVIANVVHEVNGVRSTPDGDDLKIVSIGGMVPRKRPLLAVDTVRALVDGGVDATLEWLGDGPLRDATTTYAREQGVADRIRVTGPVPPHRVADHLDQAHVFFLPTSFETFLVAAAEALARGRPVVLPEGGPYVDFVDESVGVLTTDETAEGFATAIRSARWRFRDTPPDDLRSAVLPRFGKERVGACFEEFYWKALK